MINNTHRMKKTLAASFTSLCIKFNIDSAMVTLSFHNAHIHSCHSQNSRLLSTSLSLGTPFPRYSCVCIEKKRYIVCVLSFKGSFSASFSVATMS